MKKGYKQGMFTPLSPTKYKGSQPIVYRSEPELLLMKWMDKHPSIIEWSSESIIIPYIKPTDNRVHRYYMDFSCVFQDAKGNRVRYLIEYKPSKQTVAPKDTAGKSSTTLLKEKIMFAVNMAKWNAAKSFAENQGYKFLIITEKNLS